VAVFQDITSLQELEKQREEFLSIVSHDLKNPVTAIRGRAQLLERRVTRRRAVEGGGLVDGLRQIDKLAARLATMIDELMDVARLQTERPLELNRQPTDLVALAQQVAATYRQSTERHTTRVTSTVPSLVGEWDRVRLERVVDNLVANAIKYSPSGGDVALEVRREGDVAGAWAVLRVRDWGVGIPAAELPRIFERFYRGSNVVGRIEGAGVGLAGARQIVEQHGGRISVESEEGAGTIFTVRLPLAGRRPATETAR
ncbi:MAG: sensor histidine kinase, partial [Chloroflexota bacterium]